MEIGVIASGSNGNCCLVEDKGVCVLIDAGKSGREIEARMHAMGKSIEDVDGIVITHAHSDHVSGAGVLARRYGIPLYMTPETHREALPRIGDIPVRKFAAHKSFKVRSLAIKPVATSHSISSTGFVVGKFGLFTDTGMVTKQMEAALPKLKGVLLESNHDIDMVINGHYPAYLKQWVLSDIGHLSNIHASSLIQAKGKELGVVLLGHLSGHNNTIDVARETFETIVRKRINCVVCSRDKESGCYDI